MTISEYLWDSDTLRKMKILYTIDLLNSTEID